MTEFILQYWIEVLFTSLVAFVIVFIKVIKKIFINYLNSRDNKIEDIAKDVRYLKKATDDSKRTNRTIIKDRLNQKIAHHLEDGYCDMRCREIISELYAEYKNNGGNGGMKELVDLVCNLPTAPPNKKGVVNE